MKTKHVILIVLGGLLLVLLLQNTKVVTYRLFFWQITMSQVILVPFVFFAGFFAGYWLAHFGRRRIRRPDREPAPPPPAQIAGR
jgi:uncharacterized integral membrane protein